MLRLFVFLLLCTTASAQDSTIVYMPHGAFLVATDTDEEPSSSDRGLHLQAEALLTNAYESNIDHNSEAIPSVGLVPALHLRLQNAADKPWLTVDYLLARHAYTNTERWDRTSHLAHAAVETEPLNDLTSITEAEVSFRGSSEDRDLANQYQLRQTVEVKLSQMHSVEGYGTLRYKTVSGMPEENAFKPNVGLVYQQRWPSGLRWEVAARWEVNRERVVRGNYNRTTYGAELRLPAFGSHDTIELDVRQRLKNYTDRFAEDEDGDDTDQLRQDRKWTFGATWHHQLLRRLDFELGVEIERRTSNDPDKPYQASSLLLGLAYRF